MSQFDFGVIDPAVRDGSWLADALNQWRDALYSTHGGPAAPSYIVPGMIWRDVAGAPALTRYKVREGGVDRELWTIDNTGKIQFTGAGMATQAEVNAGAVVDKAVSPATLRGFTGWITGPIGIGAAPPAGVQSYVYHATDHSILRIHAASAAPVKWTQLSLQNAARNWFISNRDDGFISISEATAGYCLTINAATGYVGVGANNATYPLEVFPRAGGDAWAVCTSSEVARVAGFAFRNAGRFYGMFVDGASNNLTITDFSSGRVRLTCDPNGGWAIGARNDLHATLALNAQPAAGYAAVLYLNSQRNWDIRSENGELRINDNTAGARRVGIDAGGKVWLTSTIACYAIEGGFGGGGVLRGHTSPNLVCFRWDGNRLLYRVDEVVEYAIGSTPMGTITSMNVVAYGGSTYGVAMQVYAAAASGYINPGYVNIDWSSDERLKTNVVPAKVDALATIRDVELIEFNHLQRHGAFFPIGFNANKLRHQIPEMVYEPPGDYLHVSMQAGVPWLFRAMQQLAERVETLERERTNGRD